MAARDGQSGAEIVPKRDFELGAGFGQTEEGVSAVTTDITARVQDRERRYIKGHKYTLLRGERISRSTARRH
jgi:hypothetical protein